MSTLDLDSLLTPVSATAPSGEEADYVPEFQQLKKAVDGQPERVMGDTVVAAVPSDWKQVIALGADLFSRSKDLHIAIPICRALLHQEGFSGLTTGMTLIRRLLTEYWDSLHPQLDTDDNNDPTARMNALADLCDRDALLTPVRTTPLVHSRTFGPVSLRDLEIATGKSPKPADAEQTPLDAASIDAAFQDCELDRLRETAGAVASAVRDLGELERFVTDQVGTAQAPDLKPIRELLGEADTLLSTKLTARTGTADAGPEVTPSTGNGAPVAATPSLDGEPAMPRGGSIAGREDVVRMLDRICDYYDRNEPSSPVPLLLQRARRLVTKDFVGIVEDLAPDGLAQIEAIRGPEGDA